MLEADYSKSLSQVYKDVVYFCHLQAGSDLNILRFSQILQKMFDRPAEMRESAEKAENQEPEREVLIEISGLCSGNVYLLGPIFNKSDLSRIVQDARRTMEHSLDIHSITTNTISWIYANVLDANEEPFVSNYWAYGYATSSQKKSLPCAHSSVRAFVLDWHNLQIGLAPPELQVNDYICYPQTSAVVNQMDCGWQMHSARCTALRPT